MRRLGWGLLVLCAACGTTGSEGESEAPASTTESAQELPSFHPLVVNQLSSAWVFVHSADVMGADTLEGQAVISADGCLGVAGRVVLWNAESLLWARELAQLASQGEPMTVSLTGLEVEASAPVPELVLEHCPNARRIWLE